MKKQVLLEQILQIEERLETAIEVAKVGFYDWDIPKNKIIFSDQMRRDWGFGLKEPLTDTEARIHPEDRDQTLQSIKDAIHSRKLYSTKYRVVRPDGSFVWIHAQGKVFYDSEDKPCRFFGTSMNITDQKNLELELEKSKLEADRANSDKSLFLAGIAHEIRNPLSGIIGFSELLKDPTLTESRRILLADKIHRHGEDLLQILNDLLDMSKIEAGKLDLNLTNISILEVVTDTCDLFAEQARKKGITLRFLPQGKIPEKIITDATRLRQVLTNLVSNAVKFTSSGGVELGLTATKSEAGVCLQFKVKDSGVGMTAAQQKKLFQPFHQGSNAVHAAFGGTGLGLFLAKQIARGLNGNITIEQSEPGVGTTFCFYTIAAVAVDSADERKAASPFEAMFSNLRVLVADDSSDTRYLTTCLLRKSGAQVTIAKNGNEACELGLHGDFDFVLMDVEMPEMDGYEATRRLRSSGYQKPIIALSGHALPNERQKTLAAGCSAHLTKPLNPEELRDIIRGGH